MQRLSVSDHIKHLYNHYRRYGMVKQAENHTEIDTNTDVSEHHFDKEIYISQLQSANKQNGESFFDQLLTFKAISFLLIKIRFICSDMIFQLGSRIWPSSMKQQLLHLLKTVQQMFTYLSFTIR